MTREDMIQQLDSLRLHARRRNLVWYPLLVLVNVPLPIYVIHLVGNHSSARTVVEFGIAGLAVWTISCLVFVVVTKRTIAQYAPACPLCSGRITWREQNTVLASGRCPHCKREAFPAG